MPKWFLSFYVVIILICAFFSDGFHHFDEHFQILEFIQFKSGSIPGSQLAWEYQFKMRSWLLPGMGNVLIEFFSFLGIKSHFTYAMLLRFFAGLFSLFITFKFWQWMKLRESFFNLFLIFIPWFLPYLSVRFSSENFGGIFFLAGSLLLLNNKASQIDVKKNVLAGVLLGLSFLCRFQMGLSIAGAFFWITLFGKNKMPQVFAALVGLGLALFIGVLVDLWGYGVWTLSCWNYFNSNIISGNVSSFGVSPWWDYLRLMFNRGVPPLSIIYLVSFFYFIWKNPKSYWSFVCIPFLAIHFIIGHKELRFLFPLFPLIPLFLASLVPRLPRRLVKFCVCINLVLLIYASTKPAANSIAFFRFLESEENKSIEKIYTFGGDPFQMVGLEVTFYKTKNIPFIPIQWKDGPPKASYVFANSKADYEKLQSEYRCQWKFSTVPKWFISSGLMGKKMWSLSLCP